MDIKSVSINNVNNSPIYGEKQKIRKTEHAPAVTFLNNSKEQNKSINFKEGMQLLGLGIKTQLHDTYMSLFGSVGAILRLVGFASGLALLPIIGIPSSVGGGVLAIGFATVSMVNAVKHSFAFIKNNNAGQYDLARKNLKTLGEDSVDLALSVPFVPKAVSRTETLIKHGKIGLNKEFFGEQGFSKKMQKLFSGKLSSELERNMYHNKAIHSEIKGIKDLPEAEIRRIEQGLRDYNVPFDKIPEVVLDKWAIENGVSAKPNWQYSTLSKNVAGYALGSECKILLTDYKSNVVPPAKFVLLETKPSGDVYLYKYQEVATGKVIEQAFPKSVADEATKLSERYHASTAQMKRILATLHEREHIDQFARLIMEKGNNAISPVPKKSALDIYQSMIEDIKAKGVSIEESEQMAKIIAHSDSRVGTYAEYINRPCEIYARQAEIDALNNPFYQHLENVYRKVNSQVKPSAELASAMLNTVRYESMVS